MEIRLALVWLALTLLSPSALADNPVDMAIRYAWKADDTSTAARMSDVAVTAGTVVSLGHIQLEGKSWRRTGAAAATLAVNAGINQLVKHLVGRTRPDGSEDVSFYSGHSSQAAGSAGVNCAFKEGPICYGLMANALFVGVNRGRADKHWASDIAVGLLEGWVAGRYGVQLTKEF